MYFFALVLVLVACQHKPEEPSASTTGLDAVAFVPDSSAAGSMPEVKQRVVDERTWQAFPAGKVRVQPQLSNMRRSGVPEVVKAATPVSITPGADTVLLPTSTLVADSTYRAGTPEVQEAKDRWGKDLNRANFSNFSKIQGLKHGDVRCLMQDHNGALWLGTLGGGASRFDGKTFVHYTEKEGLPTNMINCIMEDRNKNLWFGAQGGGITRFDGKNFSTISTNNGLENLNISSIIQEKSGCFWFGTQGGGAYRYDGKKLTHYTTRQGLCSNVVNAICEDASGNIWFGTASGLTRFDGKTFTTWTQRQGLRNAAIRCLHVERSGAIWLGTNGSGATRFNGETFEHYGAKEGLDNRVLNDIEEDKSGQIWFVSEDNGISKFDGTYFTHYNEKDGLANKSLFCMLEDRSGCLWFGLNSPGLSRFDGKTFTFLNTADGLLNSSVRCILKDRAHNVWFGTQEGLSKFDGKQFYNYTVAEGLPAAEVFTLMQDRLGNIWFGTYTGACKFDGKTFTQLTQKDGLPSNTVYNIFEDNKGNLWFGTDRGLARYDGNRIQALQKGMQAGAQNLDDLQQKDGVWVSTITTYSGRNSLSDFEIRNIMQDREGAMWFASLGNGVSTFDGKTFRNFSERNGMPSNFVLGMRQDRDGHYWFATLGQGVVRFDGKTFTTFRKKDGLTHDMAFSILEDKNGNLWFGTRFGLSLLRAEKRALITKTIQEKSGNQEQVWFRNYTYSDGFLGMGVNIGNTMVEDTSGNIWIAANDRVTVYHPSAHDLVEAAGPSIEINGLSLFNEKIDWKQLAEHPDSALQLGNGMKVQKYSFSRISPWNSLPEPLSLAYNNNYITFHYIGITTVQPQMVQYRYKLEGNDQNWSAPTYRTEAAYGNLAPGTYTFWVKAMNSEGYWCKPLPYTFTIRPPWWQRWWFRAALALLGVGLIFFYIKWRERTLKMRQAELEKKVDDATQEIRAQKEQVEREKKRSDELLLNILPEEVAEELKEKGQADARLMDEVTVLFTDFKGFTELSEKLSPQELVSEIHACFSQFDSIMQKHGVEKIKTIGDAYMAAGGLPVSNSTHAVDVVNAALDIQHFMEEHKVKKTANGEIHFEIRIGVHTGPVVAGIVGVKKFAYDIWGDTVNTASRMESSGEVGRVNISGSTYELVKNVFACTHRGKVKAKGKGEVDMYFVDR